MIVRRLLLAALLLGTAACATGQAGSALYRRDIGMASANDAMTLARQVIHRHGFVIDTEEGPAAGGTDPFFNSSEGRQAAVPAAPEIRILTHWKHRLPFEDEAAQGITSAESRVLVVARARSHTDRGSYYNITFTMENRLGVAGDPTWNSTLNTPLFQAYADEVSNDLRQLVANVGVRKE